MTIKGTRVFFAALFVSLFVSSLQVESAVASSTEVMQVGIKNLKMPTAGIYTSGQPTQEQLKAAAQAGVEHVINLRPLSEQEFDEKALVLSLGMQYHSIPVAGAEGVDFERAREFSQLVSSLKEESVLLHCASGNRVGALKALAEYESNGGNPEAAIDVGKSWGLTGLEPVVRQKLSF